MGKIIVVSIMMHHNYPHKSLIIISTLLAVSVSVVLVISKGVAWYYSGSVSVQASLIDSLLDGLMSFINLFAIRQAMKPADICHRFGHEKAEALASLGQSIFILISALWLLKEIIERLIHPREIILSPLVLWVMVGSTLLTFVLIIWQRYVIKKTGSLMIQVDSLHYKTDFLTNLGVLTTLVISTTYKLPLLDEGVGIIIVGYIFHASYQIAVKACHVLMDHELDDQIRHKIIQIATQHPKVLGIHDLRTRSSGHREFIQLHLDLSGDLLLREAHQIAEEVEKMIQEDFPRADIIIHQDANHL